MGTWEVKAVGGARYEVKAEAMDASGDWIRLYNSAQSAQGGPVFAAPRAAIEAVYEVAAVKES